MHSRIIELSKEPVLKQERISEASIPEWFCNTIADYTDANTDRDHDIKWFLSRVGNYVDVAEDGQSFTFRPKAKQMHFERSYHTFLDKVCELTGISLGAFVGETKYDIGMAMYKLNDCFNDKVGYIYISIDSCRGTVGDMDCLVIDSPEELLDKLLYEMAVDIMEEGGHDLNPVEASALERAEVARRLNVYLEQLPEYQDRISFIFERK